MIFSKGNCLCYKYEAETLTVEPWGTNAVRIRATKETKMPQADWALSEPVPESPNVKIHVPPNQITVPAADLIDPEHPAQQPSPELATLTNGNITVEITAFGKLTVKNNLTGKQILEEYLRTKVNHQDPKTSALQLLAREFKYQGNSEYQLTWRLESQDRDEKIYGMGQYQQPFLNLKGVEVELAQRNSQASVPFLVSSLGYGLLWNNPAVGRANFGLNVTTFEAKCTDLLDVWLTVDEGPRAILKSYASVTGHTPLMPEYGLGFWQCKLRYQSQDEVLTVAREYKRRGLPIDVIVVDFFHWTMQGEWAWEPSLWPNPKAMLDELESMGIKCLVSIWPTVDKRSAHYADMLERNMLVRVETGLHTSKDLLGQLLMVDFTNPDARKYVWDLAKKNYWDQGVRCFWLDEAEPEYGVYDFENMRYYDGPALKVSNVYPRTYSQAFYEGQLEAGQPEGDIVNLVRCAWAGSQKFGALVWSGDIASSWTSFRSQLSAGLSMGMAGIPWWTTDIGGFFGGVTHDPKFQELLVRWFQWGTFCPVMRLHGYRLPLEPRLGQTESSKYRSGADNEVWSFGEANYEILSRHILFRERMRDYVRELMVEAHEHGTPVMRTMFLEFPQDPECWAVSNEDQYMFGSKYLCAPIFTPGQTHRKVYLPKGASWRLLKIGKAKDELRPSIEGGRFVEVQVDILDMPVFVRQ